jgi:hypothetical protein
MRWPVLLLLTLCTACSEDPAPAGRGPYEFSEDWFSNKIPVWSEVLEPYMGRPDLRYLEVGVYEGRSVVWMVENVLTDPTSTLVAVDPFLDPPDLEARFLRNLRASRFRGTARTIKEFSQLALRRLPPLSFDIIYIDGSHTGDDVLADAVQSWELLEVGGILIFDDYMWSRPYPPDLLPKPAIDAFVHLYWKEIEVVVRGYQLIIRKRENPCRWKSSECTPFGPYVYRWNERRLRDPRREDTAIDLSDEERGLVETITLSRGLGQAELEVSPAVQGSATFQGLVNRLGITLEQGRIVR